MQNVTITIDADDVEHLRTILREQLGGDYELIQDINEDREPDETLLPDAITRVMVVEHIAPQIGGLLGTGFAADYGGGYLGAPAS